MTALMCQDPKTSSSQTLQKGIQGPQDRTDWHRGDVLWSDKVVEDIEGGCQYRNIAGDVS